MSTPFDASPVLIPDSPNEDPLSNGGRWLLVSGAVFHRSAGITEVDPGGVQGAMLWTPVFFADGAVCWVNESNPATGGLVGIYLRSTIDATTFYLGLWNRDTGEWMIRKIIAGLATTLDSTLSGPVLSVSDRLGFSAIGDTLKLWSQSRTSLGHPAPLDAGWSEVLSVVDSDISGSGYTALNMGGLETGASGARGGALFPTGDGGDLTPSSPSFDVDIRVA